MRKRIGEKGMIQGRPGIVRYSFVWCQEQTNLLKIYFYIIINVLISLHPYIFSESRQIKLPAAVKLGEGEVKSQELNYLESPKPALA